MGKAEGDNEPTTSRADSTGSSGSRKPTGVYQRGDTIWRISESVEGGLKVEVLAEGAWVAGPVNLVGLRLASDTRKLSQASIDALPA